MNKTALPSRRHVRFLAKAVSFAVVIIIVLFFQKDEEEELTPPDSQQHPISVSPSNGPISQTEGTIPSANSSEAPSDSEFELKQVREDVFVSPAGLVYKAGSADGHRLDHVMTHSADEPSKPIHGVFNGRRNDILALLDEVWNTAQERGPPTVEKKTERGRTVLTVDLNRAIGFVGGQAGRRRGFPPCEKVRLVLEEDEVITAYPVE